MTSSTIRFLLIATAMLFGLSFWGRPPIDPDLGWHLLGGAWIRANGQAPSEDFINSFNTGWQDYHWLGQVLLHAVFERAGYEGLCIAVGIAGALYGLILTLLYGRGHLPQLGIRPFILVALSLLSVQVIASVRPQFFVLLVLAGVQCLLLRRKVRGEIALLTIVTILLSNMHVYWFFVPVLWCVYRGVPRVTSKRFAHGPGYVWGGLFLFLLAPFVSPYGIFQRDLTLQKALLNHFIVLDLFSSEEIVKTYISEFRSPFALGGLVAGLFLTYLVLFIRSWRLKRALADLPNTLITLASLVLAFSAIKFLPVFAVFSLPWFAWHTRDVFKLPVGMGNAKGALATWGALLHRHGRQLSVGAVFLLFAWCFWLSASSFPVVANPEKISPDLIPFGACRAAANLDIQPSGERTHVRVLSFFDQGGWCRWIMYQQAPQKDIRVTTDNRTQWIPPRHYQLSFDLFLGLEGWQKTLRIWDPDLAVVRSGNALWSLLRLVPNDWKLVYDDGLFALFKKVRAGKVQATGK